MTHCTPLISIAWTVGGVVALVLIAVTWFWLGWRAAFRAMERNYTINRKFLDRMGKRYKHSPMFWYEK